MCLQVTMGLNGVKAETSAPSGTQSPSEDMPEGLLSHEKLPLEIPEDNVVCSHTAPFLSVKQQFRVLSKLLAARQTPGCVLPI